MKWSGEDVKWGGCGVGRMWNGEDVKWGGCEVELGGCEVGREGWTM